MGGTIPAVRKLRLGIAIVAAVALQPAVAEAAPRIVSAQLDKPATVGRPLQLRVRAVDPAAPVPGMTVYLGRRGGSAGTSACRAIDSRGRAPRKPFTAGSVVRLAVPHRFTRAGKNAGLIHVVSGDCARPGASVLQPFSVEAAPPGRKPGRLVLGSPTTLPAGSLELPDLPGADELPAPPPATSPGGPVDIPSIPVPGGPSPPGLPPLPNVPTLPNLPGLPFAAASAQQDVCRGTNQAVGRSKRRRGQARRTLLCLLNVVRYHYRLRPLVEHRVLGRAALQHSRSMVRRRYFAHVQPGGVDLIDRLHGARYLPAKRWVVGENLAFGRRTGATPLALVIAWMNSPPHRANILTRNFRQIGIGVAAGTPAHRSRGTTVTTDFGTRR